MRKIFLPPELYTGLESLSLEDKGNLLDYFYKYNLGIEFDIDNNLKIIFGFFKPFFDNDKKTYELFCESRKNNGEKGGRPKKYWENSQKPKKATEPKKPTEMTRLEKKDKYIDKVYLYINEYNNLIKDYGLNIIESKIEDLNNYIVNTKGGKDPYSDHNLTIRSWLKKEGVKKKEDKPKIEVPTTDAFFSSFTFMEGQE